MSVVLNYQLSIFGKYSIVPSPDTISIMMNRINSATQETLLPNVINSQQIEIPTNKVSTVANLGFISPEQQYSIAILNERIDINYNKVNESDVDIKVFYQFAIKALSEIMEYSNLSSNRLAMNIQCVSEVEDYTKLKTRGKELLKNAKYYDDKDFVEWSMRTNTQVDIAINKVTETINVITDISSGQDATGKKVGALYHIDINTLPQNQNMRFDKCALEPFVKEGLTIASNIMTDVERLINNEE